MYLAKGTFAGMFLSTRPRLTEKCLKPLQDLPRSLFCEIVPAVDGAARHLRCAILPPDRQRVVPSADLALRAPQHQQRALDLPASLTRGTVVLQVDGGGGAVVLAHAADGLGVSRGGEVVGQRLWMEEAGRLRLARCVGMEPHLRCGIDEHLG